MKKITAYTIAVIMAMSITACGDTDKSSAKKQESKSSAAASDENSISEKKREDLLKAANTDAKTGYNAVAEYLADMETEGRLSEATEQEAAKIAAESISSYGNINGTVGVRFDEPGDYGFLNFTVQFRADEDSTVIGQYPDPAQSIDDIPEWSAKAEASCEISESANNDDDENGDGIISSLFNYRSKSKLKSANGNAKTAYNAVAEYLADMECEGRLSEATPQEAAAKATKWFQSNESCGIVGVRFIDISNCEFEALWREDSSSDIIGRYPEPAVSLDDHIEWIVDAECKIDEQVFEETEYDDREDDNDLDENAHYTDEEIDAFAAYLEEAQSNMYEPSAEEKKANDNAKIAYIAAADYLTGMETPENGDGRDIVTAFVRSEVAEYIAGMEMTGELTSEKKQEAANIAAKALKDAGVDGKVGLLFIELDSLNPDFCVMWKNETSGRLIGVYPQLAPNDMLAWECDVVAHVE